VCKMACAEVDEAMVNVGVGSDCTLCDESARGRKELKPMLKVGA
jgi:bacterioferritin-associated ferredoxin